MIVWLASYPKSGNTYLRALLSGYLFSKDGNFDFPLLRNISQFPDKVFFEGLDINLNDNSEVAKNYINAQKNLNKGKNTIQFFKTHSAFCKINGHNFTDLQNTLGVIYIVRDPRNVVISQSVNGLMTSQYSYIGSNIEAQKLTGSGVKMPSVNLTGDQSQNLSGFFSGISG